ncbi:MAG: VWA domain-containing protein [Nitrososphaera sp.]|nr:VWA domain-containing protein [Nitrososphaera sp.]
MRKESLTLSMLVSFNELAWILVFALVLLYSIQTTRLAAELDANTGEVEAKEKELNEEKQKSAETESELAEELNNMRRQAAAHKDTDDRLLHQRLIGLEGVLRRSVIIVDRSGSMKRGGRWEDARRVIKTWLEYLPIEQCALITFSDKTTSYPTDQEFLDVTTGLSGEKNRAKLLEQLDQIDPEGHTNTLRALREAYEYHGVDTIILFTDGFPDSGSGQFDNDMAEKIYALAQAHKDIPINTIGLGDYFDAKLGKFLLRLSLDTGGTFIGR